MASSASGGSDAGSASSVRAICEDADHGGPTPQRRVEHVPDQSVGEAPCSTRGARLQQNVGGDALVKQRDELG